MVTHCWSQPYRPSLWTAQHLRQDMLLNNETLSIILQSLMSTTYLAQSRTVATHCTCCHRVWFRARPCPSSSSALAKSAGNHAWKARYLRGLTLRSTLRRPHCRLQALHSCSFFSSTAQQERPCHWPMAGMSKLWFIKERQSLNNDLSNTEVTYMTMFFPLLRVWACIKGSKSLTSFL